MILCPPTSCITIEIERLPFPYKMDTGIVDRFWTSWDHVSSDNRQVCQSKSDIQSNAYAEMVNIGESR